MKPPAAGVGFGGFGDGKENMTVLLSLGLSMVFWEAPKRTLDHVALRQNRSTVKNELFRERM